MRCKRCGAEWQEKTRTCPVCGRRHPRVWLIATVAGVSVLLAALLTAGVILLVSHVWDRVTSPPNPPLSSGEQTTPTTESRTVRVTFPEGYTVLQMADLLQENSVCSAEEFIDAVQNSNFEEYDFVADIPLTDENGEPNGRVFRLEGYLYPDTYEFYKNSSGEAAVRRFLDNFSRKWQAVETLLDQSELEMTTDEVVTLASIIQWEAGHVKDMPRISRVLHNRLQSVDYPRLQCDVTTRYLRALKAAGIEAKEEVYSTYICRDLPIGAINNPSVNAMLAAVAPSEEDVCKGCYFFVTDAANDAVYYSRTYAEHLATCRKYKLGSFAE